MLVYGVNGVWSLGISSITQSYRVGVCTEEKQSFNRDRRVERECRELTCITFRLQESLVN